MGNDGGSIPRRNEMVREKKKDEKIDRKAQLIAMFFSCALSKQPLQQPIVADGLGRLYNREAVLEYLLDNSKFGDGNAICAHIRGLKDIKTLQLHPNPSLTNVSSDNGTIASKKDGKEGLGSSKQQLSDLSFGEQPTARFVCPVTMKEMNGNLPFELAWPCGCVFSALARKEMRDAGSSVAACVVCGESVDSTDIIPINSQDTDVLDVLRRRMEQRTKRKKTEKKSKSKTKHKRSNSNEDCGENGASGSKRDLLDRKKIKLTKECKA
ncbi:Replication termination factor 2 [Coemansia erecta]|uniref:Replication termination factor 2 n=1 Tax=Coemansia asiatica TaxID=1052880 RepID=A0A9W7XL11_9FUNG|nr:Replication termination factor 2 [Coemansia asiatica]KAJ2849397.1 Replication termination factor 2 [Coemansia erecta]KAJ2877964.1 Replication termination factor 2 [Coemansia asiatica]